MLTCYLHRTKILRSQAGRDDIGMVVAFTFYLVYLVCQLSGVAHGSGKKRYLVDDHTAQTGLMVSRLSFRTIHKASKEY